MAETLRDLVVSLSLQSDNFTRNIRSVNKQIQEAESFFKLAAAGVEGFDKSTEGLASRLSTLQQKLSLQRNVVDQYQKALQAARRVPASSFPRVWSTAWCSKAVEIRCFFPSRAPRRAAEIMAWLSASLPPEVK